MPTRKTTLMAATGVKLTQVEEVTGARVIVRHYRLTTMRQAPPRVFADRNLADAAFIVEVAASKQDPTALKLAISGL